MMPRMQETPRGKPSCLQFLYKINDVTLKFRIMTEQRMPQSLGDVVLVLVPMSPQREIPMA